MKNHIPSSSAPLRGALSLVALFGFAATPVYGADYSAYATIQPNGTFGDLSNVPQVETATIGALLPPQAQVETLTLSNNNVGTSVAQQETATVAVPTTVTADGTTNVTVTSTGTPGSPFAVEVAVAGGDTAAAVATKIRDALAGVTGITNFYTVTNPTTTTVRLTRIAPSFANLATTNLNIAIAGGNGITAAATSANTVLGVGGQGVLNITVTAAGMTGGSPKTIGVNVTNGMTPPNQAIAVAAALNEDTNVSDFFTATAPVGTSRTVVLTRTAFAANDADMNVASAPLTCVGPVAVATSANTAAGYTLDGDITITVRGAAIAGSPLAVPVAALNSDTADGVATKVRTALNGVAAITDFYTVGGATDKVTLTKTSAPYSNDTTLNISVSPGTANIATLATSESTSAQASMAQVETQTVVGTITSAGDATITVTIAGSPLDVVVPLDASDTASQVATKFRAELNAVPAITGAYTVGGTGADVTLTKAAAPFNNNDATLNIAYTNTTCAGLTPNATSVNTTATHYVYTISWAALDSQFSAGSAYDDPTSVTTRQGSKDFINSSTPFGNGTTAIDDQTILFGGTDLTVVGVNSQKVLVKANNNATPFAITTTNSSYQLPMDYTVGVVAPDTTTPKWDDVGGFAPINNGDLLAGIGLQGVTGVIGSNPDGSNADAASTLAAKGAAIYIDEDEGGNSEISGSTLFNNLGNPTNNTFDDIGMVFVNYADATTAFFNTQGAPQKGYLRMEVPIPWSDPNVGLGAGNPFLQRFMPGVHTSNAAIELTVTMDPNYVPKLAVSGDLNADQVVDVTDLNIAKNINVDLNLTNFTKACIPVTAPARGKYFRHGDTNGDMDVDNADLGVIIGAYSPAVASPTKAKLIYDPLTGNVKLDPTTAAGAKITSFHLENISVPLLTVVANPTPVNPFLFNSYNPVTGGTYNTDYKDVAATVIGDTDTTPAPAGGFSGLVDIGNVFPIGLDLTTLAAYLKTAVYTGVEGSGQQQFDLALASGSPFDTWAATGTLGPVTFNGDTNGDGVQDGLAFLLGVVHPDDDATGNLPTVTETAGGLVLDFSWLNAANRGTATLKVEHSTDLVSWMATDVVPDADDAVPDNDVTFLVTPGSPLNSVTATIAAAAASGGKLFGRLEATQP